MKVKYQPQPKNIYIQHYMRGGSSIGEYFRANSPYHYGGGILSSFSKIALPIFKNVIKPIIKTGIKKAMPMIKQEGSKFLKSGLKDVSEVLQKKQTTRQMIDKNKKKIKKRVADIIESHISPKNQKSDIFNV